VVPDAIRDWTRIRMFGGGTLIFDEYGQVKYQIANHLLRTAADRKRQEERIRHLHESGYFERPAGAAANFAQLHRARGGAGGPA
jgi:hypothetical protein